MLVITDFLNWLADLPPALLLIGAGLLVFGETTLGLGFIAPGETGLFILGTTATSVPKFLLMWVVTTACAVLGYTVGFLLGKYFGPKLRQTKMVQRHGADAWDNAVGFLRRRGAIAVMIAIFLPVMRTLVPAAAGAAGLPYRKFLPAAGIAGTAWCALHIGIGAALGESAKWLESAIGKGSWVVLLLLVAVFGLVMLIKRRKSGALAEAVGAQPPAAKPGATDAESPGSESENTASR
ncbi:DedA family protein [Haloechinothrix halophila]|uniref:DedA family protein n=1 Tax=Haloechinothrix halophila TaxID=1069073 RepID=UPI0006886786|nr:DedA family protein [Haloechinothrix halophila]